MYANPITVDFQTAVNGFSVQITNEINNTYQITDNLGHSTTLHPAQRDRSTLTMLLISMGGIAAVVARKRRTA